MVALSEIPMDPLRKDNSNQLDKGRIPLFAPSLVAHHVFQLDNRGLLSLHCHSDNSNRLDNQLLCLLVLYCRNRKLNQLCS